MNKKLNVALFFGGDSGEYEVSVGSAEVVGQHLACETLSVYPILVRAGEWTYTDAEGHQFAFDRNSHSLWLGKDKITFDCAFIAIHGTPGEDGKLQGYLEMAGIPYTSCDVTTSAITFNKYFCYDLANQYGAYVAQTILLSRHTQWDAESLAGQISFPCFVKPNKSGSSVGVSKVYDLSGLLPAIEKAFGADDEVLVQQYIKGREMGCGVYQVGGTIKVLPVTEIIPQNDFFDYEAKYTSGKSAEITPAHITIEQNRACSELTAYLYRKFNCKGVVRFDYFLIGDEWWFLEVNTVPGFSSGSIVPQQVRAAGISLDDFFRSLVYDAIARK